MNERMKQGYVVSPVVFLISFIDSFNGLIGDIKALNFQPTLFYS
jgi:hypothetical protein